MGNQDPKAHVGAPQLPPYKFILLFLLLSLRKDTLGSPPSAN